MGLGQRIRKIFRGKAEEPTVTEPVKPPESLSDLLKRVVMPKTTKGAEGLIKGVVKTAEMVGVPPETLAKFKRMNKYKLSVIAKENPKAIQAYFDYNLDYDEDTDLSEREQQNIDNISKIVDLYEERYGAL